MPEKFNAELLTRTERNSDGRLEVDLVDVKGCSQKLVLSAGAAAALFKALGAFVSASSGKHIALTKRPKTFAVGHGRHEDVVLIRFEDDPAYALSAEQAAELSEFLLDEAHDVSETHYALKQ